MDNEQYILIFENPDGEIRGLIDQIIPLCKEKYVVHSSAGMETINLVINMCELVILFIQYPLLIQIIQDKKIIVKFKGFIIKGCPDKIIKKVKNNSDLLAKVRKVYKNNELEIEGEVGGVAEFDKKLKELLDIEME